MTPQLREAAERWKRHCEFCELPHATNSPYYVGDALLKHEQMDNDLDALATYAAEQRAGEVEGIIRDLTKSFECYTAQNKPLILWDEYDQMILPIWERAISYLATTTNGEGER
jgi:hypothetical protein